MNKSDESTNWKHVHDAYIGDVHCISLKSFENSAGFAGLECLKWLRD